MILDVAKHAAGMVSELTRLLRHQLKARPKTSKCDEGLCSVASPPSTASHVGGNCMSERQLCHVFQYTPDVEANFCIACSQRTLAYKVR